MHCVLLRCAALGCAVCAALPGAVRGSPRYSAVVNDRWYRVAHPRYSVCPSDEVLRQRESAF